MQSTECNKQYAILSTNPALLPRGLVHVDFVVGFSVGPSIVDTADLFP
jgi:hypothetical protein